MKEDENVTVKCILRKKIPKGTKESDPKAKTIGYIRSSQREPFFGEVKFDGHDLIELPGSIYLGKYKHKRPTQLLNC